MKIKNVEIKNGIFLAPLAGVTDSAYRQICKKCGAEYMVSEMISAKAIKFKDKKTIELAQFDKSELPYAVQLFGSAPECISYAAKFICDNFAVSAIDINMGCPVPKIAGNGDGSVLMREPKKAAAVMEAAVRASSLPVTVKIRSGWNDEEKNAPEIAKIAEDSGISAVFVHGRTRMQMYRPPVDFNIIAEVKRTVKIPVIGNGDIYSPADAMKMKEFTNCDGIMIARGSLGNPWIFSELLAFMENTPYIPPSPSEKYALILEHLDLMASLKSEKTAVFESRKHLSWYIKGIQNAASLRDAINRTLSFGEMKRLIREVYEE